jgi:hypothetical protein
VTGGVTVVTAKDAREHCQKLLKQRQSVRMTFLEASKAIKNGSETADANIPTKNNLQSINSQP